MLEIGDDQGVIAPSATVVIARDGSDGLELLLVQRSAAVKHIGGMWVFPGGKVDSIDREQADDDLSAACKAAIRETAEEAGLSITAEQLVPMSHWTTPKGVKRRFSTWFFLAILDDDQEVVVDGGEIALHRWVRPEVALEELWDKQSPFTLLPPTFVSLIDLREYQNCEAARAGLSSREPIKYVPKLNQVDGGMCFLYEGDAGYASSDVDAVGPQHRTYMTDTQFEYIRRLA